jgi:hypothetical protein
MFPAATGLDVPPEILLKFLKILAGEARAGRRRNR